MKKTTKKETSKKTKKQQLHKKSTTVQENRRARAKELDAKLKSLFPNATMALQWKTHFELLFAVILSAQCTDKKVNEVTEMLFKKYPTLNDYIEADVETFERDIRQTGFYRNKARNIIATAKMLQEKYKGVVPRTMEEMLTLPGVARKTANVVLGNAYGIVEGIAVDTHVKRFAIRYSLTDSHDPVKIEQDLMALLPKKDWFHFTYRAIEYGRTIAPARKYDTSKDPLIAIYPPAGNVFRV